MKRYWVYILCSKRNGTLYIGVTNNLLRRVYEHKEQLISGFTKKYDINKLVYFEEFSEMYEAICREKCLKKWKILTQNGLIYSINLSPSNWIPAFAGTTKRGHASKANEF